MARTRMLKPEFFQNAELYDAEVRSRLPLRLAYEGLWCQADREGRFAWKPRALKLHILPYDDLDFEAALDALEVAGFITSYVVDGKRFAMIPTFKAHQHFHVKESPSRIPPPPEPGASPVPAPGKPESSTPASTSTSDTASDAAVGAPRRRQLDRCRAEMPDHFRPALEGAIRSHRNADALAGELCMLADGLHGTAYPWEVIGKALHDMAVAGTQMSPNILRAFCRKAAESPFVEGTDMDRLKAQVEKLDRERDARMRRVQ